MVCYVDVRLDVLIRIALSRHYESSYPGICFHLTSSSSNLISIAVARFTSTVSCTFVR